MRVKPTAQKIAEGNPGKRKSDIENNEPQPAVLIPPCPEHLSDAAKVEYDYISRILVRNKLLTEIDGQQLALLCQSWGRWVEAEEKIASDGLVYDYVTEKGNIKYDISPYVKIAQTEMVFITRCLQLFGMTPVARVGLNVTPSAPGDDPNETKWQAFQRLTLVKKNSIQKTTTE